MALAKQRDNEEEEYTEAPAPPDGGWGWVVVFASFMVHVIFDGITYSFGIFYDEFLEYFQEGKGLTSWILSLLVGVTNLSGPISSVLVNKYGDRTVIIAGALLSSASLAISYFAQNVQILCLTIGVGLGLGIGLMYLPAIVCVTTWFEKRRSLATGIAVCGSGAGTFAFAPLITKLLALYGWRVSMLIVAAIVLLCVVFGALFRPFKVKLEIPARKPTLGSIPIEVEASDEEAALKNHHDSTNGTPKFKIRSKTLSLNLSNAAEDASYKNGPLDKADVFYQGELMNIPAYLKQVSLTEELGDEARRVSIISYKRRRSSTSPKKTTVCCIPCAPETKHLLYDMLDLKLFTDPVFIIFVISNFFVWLGFNIPYDFIVPKARTHNISNSEAGYLISVIGIANTIGRIVLGFICDIPWINRKQVYIWCLTACGFGTVVCGFLEEYYALAAYCAVFGFTIGAYVGLSTVILVDLIGLDKLTNGFGHVLLFAGFASIIGAPIGGWLYDATGSYSPAFYFGGSALAASGLVLLLIYPIQNWKNKKVENREGIPA